MEYSDNTMRTSGYLVTEGDFAEEVEDALFAAGFIWEDYYEDYELPDYWMTYLYVDVMRDCTVIQFYGSYKPIPVEPHTAAEASAAIVDFYANQNMVVEVPEYATTNSDAYFTIKEQPSIDGLEVDVFESDWDEMFDFALEMEVAGWTVADGEYDGDYIATFEFDDGSYAQIDIQDWIDYSYGCIRLICTYAAPAEFPAETVAADLAAMGITDEVPPFPGFASKYSYYQPGHQLQIMGKVGQEEANVALYQAAFVAAGYTDTGSGQNGYNHFTSPSGMLDVRIWCYPTNYPGYVVVDFDSNEIPEAPTNAYDIMADLLVISGDNNYTADEYAEFGYLVDNGDGTASGQCLYRFYDTYFNDALDFLEQVVSGEVGINFPKYLSFAVNPFVPDGEDYAVALAVTPNMDFGVMFQGYDGGDGYYYLEFLAAPIDYFMD